jgi:hypothetical protein
MEARLAQVEALVAAKQGTTDQRSATLHALTRELTMLRASLAAGREEPHS